MSYNPTYQGIKDFYANKVEFSEDHGHKEGIKEFREMKNAILDLHDGFWPDIYHESDICNRCLTRGPAIVFTDGLRLIPLCEKCMDTDYNMDFWSYKYVLLLSYLYLLRMEWRDKYG